jgi:PiT family inorganic phosphate transporter
VFQGSGTAQTLGKLGAVNALGGSFTVALAAAVTIFAMTKLALPVSTTQAIVGAIIGWNLFTGNQTDSRSLTQIAVTWITGPFLGAGFAIALYALLRLIRKKAGIHILKFESLTKTGLLAVGAFGAYSLGANNIANVMGVFIPAFMLPPLNLGIITLNSAQQLFLLGGFAIAAGILTYSKKVMETVGSNIIELSSEAALVVVLAQSMVLFIFSSSALSGMVENIGLPAIPLVPVSSSQVIVGCIMGIGIYKGVRNINFRMLGEIAAGWIAAPVASAALAFFSLFFMKNIFGINVGTKLEAGTLQKSAFMGLSDPRLSEIFRYALLSILIAALVSAMAYFLYDRKRKSELRRSEEKFWMNLK